MRHVIVTVLLAGLFSSTARTEERHAEVIVCHDQQGYSTKQAFIYLDEDFFTRETLRSYFSAFSNNRTTDESYLLVSADRAFIGRLEENVPYPPSTFQTVAPLAYFFDLGKDCFFGFRDREGKVDWVTLRGENLFFGTVGGARVEFAHMIFRGSLQDGRCRTSGRSLGLVVENLSEMSVEEMEMILSFYHRRLLSPQLSVHLTESFRNAAELFQEHSYSQPLRKDPVPVTSGLRVFYSTGTLRIWDYRKSTYILTKEWEPQ
jgi:hypothetical protein